MTNSSPKSEIFANRRILAADDDPIMREMMRARLGREVEVVCAENGEVAWEKLVAEDFDLAIIDLGMPKLDGFGLIQYLRQTAKTVDLPIIVATSRGDNEAIEKAFSSGASGFVTKPINWSLFKYDVQFVLKNGLTERELRATKQSGEQINQTKDNLIAILTEKLTTQAGAPNLSNHDKDLMLFAKLLRAAPPMTTGPLNVNQLIDTVTAAPPQLASQKAVKILGRRILADIEINVDASLWANAFERLIARAVRHSPPGGTVEIVIGSQPDNSLVFSVRDNGPLQSQAAIAAEMANFTATSPTGPSDDQTHSQLDLALVKRIAEIHGGKPLFQSDAASGNIAALWLPASRITVLDLQETA